VVQVLNTR